MASLGTAKKAPGYKGKALTKKYGKGWQKKVYGKDYKYGTVKNLNKTIKGKRALIGTKKRNITEARKDLKTTTDSGERSALKNRLKALEYEKNSAAQQIKGSKESRQKFLNLREKALSTVMGKVAPNQVGSARKAKVKERLNEKTTNGGTVAPNDSSAQNNEKPHKVNVGEQRSGESGRPKSMQRQPKTNEGRKNKAQNISGGTTAR